MLENTLDRLLLAAIDGELCIMQLLLAEKLPKNIHI